ncbi:transcription factor LHW [Vigna radiata var. radiata]|uniref:Transcription factor LHW n=1 Tax=Vigna radiata var. radiata TaxID=3916 RepID=A0A1S3T9H1_VIGRR|nr:transcription factor LHW [Vigna radiata var. radiata]
MGFLLKEALRTLCGRNQWSYAVFWKIGCHNSKLLIWEECYYEPLPCPPPMFGMGDLPYQNGGGHWFSSGSQPSQLGIQEEDRVNSLINKMTVNNSVIIAGEGTIGRAAFTGSHQWILLNSFTKDVYPQELYPEVHHQFSAGIQTVAVIPVLPHGVCQFGSFLPINENMGFVNDVKSLILQLGCVPGALLSEDYSANLSIERFAGPSITGVPVSIKPPVITSNCTLSVANASNQKSNSFHTSRPFVQTPCHLNAETSACQGSALILETCKLNQIPSNHCQPNVIPMSETHFSGQQRNGATEDEVIISDVDSCQQQHSVSHNARSTFDNLTGSGSFGQSCQSDDHLTLMEQQIISAIGNRDNVNPCFNVSSTLNMLHLQTDGGHILGHSTSSSSAPPLGGIPIHGGMSTLLRSNLITSPGSQSPKASTADLSREVGIALQNSDSSTKARGCSSAISSNQCSTFHMHVEGSNHKMLPVDLKCVSTNQKIDYDLHQAGNLPTFHVEQRVPISGQIPGLAHDCLSKDDSIQSMMAMNPKLKLDCTKPPSGDDLFDVLGVDLKNKLLNGNWNKLFADELDANTENMDKKLEPMNMPGTTTNPDIYSVKEAISDSGMFSGTGTDHLLDAVVSKAKSVVKQDSDDMSCRTTLTRNSTSSVPSPSRRPVMSGNFQGGLFDFPKNGGKTGATEASFLMSRCNKEDAGNCSQTSSTYGSQLSSWVENSGSVKRENSVSTGYSKRTDEACKPNRKRLKPGENPRPRPKDRQMIQDRVKELREIVPNGAKCSIDALLERTIKHMLFLQSVTKHADKLKQTGESKIINKEGGLLLKDNFEGGATWAYEVGSQSMVCPIVVEDLNPPRQMLVEMLCEKRGFFLEIADLIRGLGLTILKGVMEAHNDKIWARFAVEANRDVTRMEIFMSLVRLLEQTVKGKASSSSNAIDNMVYHSFPQAAQIPATGRPSSLQ